MLNTQRLAAAAAIVAICVVLAGCSDNSASTEATTGTSGTTAENALASSVAQSEMTLLRLAGIDTTNTRGIFSLGWRQMFNPRNQTESTLGQAMAIGFDGTQSTAGPRGGVDMGTVYLNYGSNHLALQQHTGPGGGVIYASSFGPREAGTNIDFISGGTYQFEASGSSKFSTLSTSVTAPGSLINISAPVRGDSISTANDLVISWSGGKSDAGILIVVAAQPPRPMGGPPQGPPGGFGGPPPNGGGDRGPGGGGIGPPPGDHPPMFDSTKAIVVKLDNNPGTYTVAAAKLQELVSRMSTRGLLCTVSQMSVNDVDHDGGIVHVVFRNGDGVMVKVQ